VKFEVKADDGALIGRIDMESRVSVGRVVVAMDDRHDRRTELGPESKGSVTVFDIGAAEAKALVGQRVVMFVLETE
jgi:hypothetical protein